MSPPRRVFPALSRVQRRALDVLRRLPRASPADVGVPFQTLQALADRGLAECMNPDAKFFWFARQTVPEFSVTEAGRQWEDR